MAPPSGKAGLLAVKVPVAAVAGHPPSRIDRAISAHSGAGRCRDACARLR